MSVRAHFIKSIDYDTKEVFNLWRDEEFIDNCLSYFNDERNQDGLGFMEISDDNFRELKEAHGDNPKIKPIIDEIEALFKRDDNDMPGWVRFWCF